MGTVRLGVDLQEGFVGGPVEVRVDGEVVLDADDVRSHPLTGVALSVVTEIERGAHVVDVKGRDIGEVHHAVTVNGDVYLGIDADTGRVIESPEPFGYS